MVRKILELFSSSGDQQEQPFVQLKLATRSTRLPTATGAGARIPEAS